MLRVSFWAYFLDTLLSLLLTVYYIWYTLPAVEQGLNLASLRGKASPPFDDMSLHFRWVGTTCAQVKVLGFALCVSIASSLSLRLAAISFCSLLCGLCFRLLVCIDLQIIHFSLLIFLVTAVRERILMCIIYLILNQSHGMFPVRWARLTAPADEISESIRNNQISNCIARVVK